MSTHCHQERKIRSGLEWRAALLALAACVGLILVQVPGSLHLILASHCVDHEVGACGEWHGSEHSDHAEDTHPALVHQHPAQSGPATTDGAHCPYTLTDHPGQANAKAPLGSQNALLSGQPPQAFCLHVPGLPALSGSQHPDLGPLRTLLKSAAAPRGPPCIV